MSDHATHWALGATANAYTAKPVSGRGGLAVLARYGDRCKCGHGRCLRSPRCGSLRWR